MREREREREQETKQIKKEIGEREEREKERERGEIEVVRKGAYHLPLHLQLSPSLVRSTKESLHPLETDKG